MLAFYHMQDQARRLSGAVQIFLGGGKKATMKVTMLSVVIIIQSNDFLVLSPLYTILDCVYSIWDENWL